MGWNVIDLICSIISSYVYGWMAVFGTISADGEPNYAVIYLDYTFFIIFTITILITFITDYTPQGENTSVKNLEKIAKRYLGDKFIYDFIAIIPFHWLMDMSHKNGNHRWNTLFLIKVIRMRKISDVFNIQMFMNEVKQISYSRLERMIESDPELAENQRLDNNNIELLMKISYSLKTLKLAITIFNISYFVGIVWLIFCDFTGNTGDGTNRTDFVFYY
jgi:hypothetical protein